MFYVILDFEWNNTYDYKAQTGTNEITEIGAVKLNSNLEITDTFKRLIKPRIAKKLSKRFVDLTGITMEEIKKFGISFEAAFYDFERWCGKEDIVFMSWSNSDLYVLTSNFEMVYGSPNIRFIKKYVDLQKYCQSFIDVKKGEQISLSHCAEQLQISIEEENMHRALEDCYVSAECFKKLYDESKLAEFLSLCDVSFFERLAFKPYFITQPVSEYFDFYNYQLLCPECKSVLRRVGDFKIVNKSFCTVTFCPKCRNQYTNYVRVKKTYDKVYINCRAVFLPETDN